MNANPILLQMKYTRVVCRFAELAALCLDDALAFFYHSLLYQLVRDGISDMHCMSDAYLAQDLLEEWQAANAQSHGIHTGTRPYKPPGSQNL